MEPGGTGIGGLGRARRVAESDWTMGGGTASNQIGVWVGLWR